MNRTLHLRSNRTCQAVAQIPRRFYERSWMPLGWQIQVVNESARKKAPSRLSNSPGYHPGFESLGPPVVPSLWIVPNRVNGYRPPDKRSDTDTRHASYRWTFHLTESTMQLHRKIPPFGYGAVVMVMMQMQILQPVSSPHSRGTARNTNVCVSAGPHELGSPS